MKTQKEKVLAMLKNWTSPLRCLQKGGGMRLSAHIYQLKAEGYEIEDLYPDGAKYKLYRLKK